MAEYEKKVRERLKQNGCSFVRHGKGDHDIRKKALRQAVGRLEEKKAEECRKTLYEALKNGDKERFISLADFAPDADLQKRKRSLKVSPQ